MDTAIYDLSRLKPNGSHYVAIGFSAPYCLHLPNEAWEISLGPGERPATVQVVHTKRWRNLHQGMLLPGVAEIERVADRRGTYCYSSFLVYIAVRGSSAEIHSNYDEVWKAVNRDHHFYRDKAVIAVNRLIEIYRFHTGECHVKPLAGHDVWFDYSFALFFNEYPSDAPQPKFSGTVLSVYDIHDLVPATPDIPETVLANIRSDLVSKYQIQLSDELLLNAHDFLDQGNHRLAVIEAETGFEAALFSFLNEHYRNRIKIKNYTSPIDLIKDKPFQTAMNSKKKHFGLESPFYENWHRHVWEVRNRIVHGRVPNVTYEVAANVIQVVEKTLEYVVNRDPIKPWKYSV